MNKIFQCPNLPSKITYIFILMPRMKVYFTLVIYSALNRLKFLICYDINKNIINTFKKYQSALAESIIYLSTFKNGDRIINTNQNGQFILNTTISLMQGQTDIEIPPWADLLQEYPFIKYFQKIFRHYTKCGEQQSPQLYPLQVKALPHICSHNKNLLCVSPTSSGKSFVFYMCILQYIWKFYVKQKNTKDLSEFKVIYIAPTKAVCQEKINQLMDISVVLKRERNIILNPFYLSSDTKYDEEKEKTKTNLQNSNIIICTLEMCHYLFKFHKSLVEELKMFLVDQIHMIACENRGYLLEIIINRVLYMKDKQDYKNLRIVSVTASVPNFQTLANWTNSQIITHFTRPVKIKLIEPKKKRTQIEGVIHEVEHYYTHEQDIYNRKGNMKNQMLNIIKQFEIQFQKQGINRSPKSENFLIFCTSRTQTETACKNLCYQMKQDNFNFNRPNSSRNQNEWWQSIKNEVQEKVKNNKLKQLIKSRVAFHHASLLPEDKQYVLKLMKDGWIIVIFCTTTLSQGVNLPVKAVIIMDLVRSKKQTQNQEDEEILYKSSDIDQMIGRAGRNKKDGVAYCAILGHHNNTQRYLQPLRNQQSIVLQQVQSKLMDKFEQFVIFQLSYCSNFLTPSSSTQLLLKFQNSLWAKINHDNPHINQILANKLSSTQQQFREYLLDQYMLDKISYSFITFQSYKQIMNQLQNWDKRESNFYSQEKQFLRMACSIDEIIIPHKSDKKSDQQTDFNELIKVPYPWKNNQGSSKKERSITKAVFLVQTLLKGDIEMLNDNYAVKMDCYEITYLFKQVCKLIHQINFKNLNFRYQTVGVIFWCQIYIKYCRTATSHKNELLFKMIESWYSHLNIAKYMKQILAQCDLNDAQLNLEELKTKKQVNRWGNFQIIKLLLQNPDFRIKKMVKDYKIRAFVKGQNFQIRTEINNQLKFYIFENIGNKYFYKYHCQDQLLSLSKNRKFIVIAIFPQLKGLDAVIVLDRRQILGYRLIPLLLQTQKNKTKQSSNSKSKNQGKSDQPQPPSGKNRKKPQINPEQQQQQQGKPKKYVKLDQHRNLRKKK